MQRRSRQRSANFSHAESLEPDGLHPANAAGVTSDAGLRIRQRFSREPATHLRPNPPRTISTCLVTGSAAAMQQCSHDPEAVRPCSQHPIKLSAEIPGQGSQYSTMPVPRRDFNQARDIGTESSNGSFAILFMATSQRRTTSHGSANLTGSTCPPCTRMVLVEDAADGIPLYPRAANYYCVTTQGRHKKSSKEAGSGIAEGKLSELLRGQSAGDLILFLQATLFH